MKNLFSINQKTRFLFAIAISSLLIPARSWSQQNQFASNHGTAKIALVDHSRLRVEYKAYCVAKETMANIQVAKKRSFDESMKNLDMQQKLQLKANAKKGGKNNVLIIRKFKSEKAQLIARFNEEKKKIDENTKAQLRAYENKIHAVIGILVSQGGFTEVKDLKKTEIQDGTDITSRVLENLN